MDAQIKSNRFGRRGFLQVTGIGLAGAALSTPACASLTRHNGHARAAGGSNAPRAKNVIFMVSDGMSTGTLTLADMMIHHRAGKRSNWVNLWSAPGVRRAMCTTSSADSLVTDSSAAGSTWGCGEHINNGAVNFTPDQRQPEPILVTARDAGKATGLVTTARVTHATPASFIANIPDRGLEGGIAEQILERRVDVALGGGAKHFPADLLAQYPDVAVARTANDLAAAPKTGRLLGIFDSSHVPYVLDRGPEVPSLPTMARAALDRLDAHADGFVLQIEGGRVDHAAHANDAGALVTEQIEFDEAIAVALDFARDRDDTLVIITTDHGNANPGLTLYGKGGNEGFERLGRARHSFDWFWDRVNADHAFDTDSARLGEIIAEMTGGIELNAPDLEWLRSSVKDHARVDGFWARSNAATCTLASLLANHYGVSFLSPNHTCDMVEVTALGPGAERLAPAIDNIDLHGLMLDAMAIAPVTTG
ncbi:MAG: alkaline phosphatase [Phycisphaerales bacterium]